MKKLKSFASFAMLALLAFSANAAFPPVGPVNFRINADVQALNHSLTHSRTNISGTTTNITQTFRSTTTNLLIRTRELLKLLENSFDTNYPAGARLATDGNGGFYVMDSTGSNFIQNVSSVFGYDNDLIFPGDGNVFSGIKVVVNNYTDGFEHANEVQLVEISYNDNSRTTTDGTHTVFSFKGLVSTRFNEEFGTFKFKASFQMQGVGKGFIHDGPSLVLDGIMLGHVKGVD